MRQLPAAAAFARAALMAAFLWAALPAPMSEHLAVWWATAQHEDVDTAQQALDHVVAVVGHDARIQVRAYVTLVDMYLAAGNDEAARIYLYALADANGWTPARRAQLRMIVERLGETAQATALLTAATDQQPDPGTLRELARHAVDQSDWTQAESLLAALIINAPNDTWAFYQLGLIVAPQNSEYAADYLSRAALDPAYTVQAESILAVLPAYTKQPPGEAHTLLGITLAGLGEWPFAERVLDMALEVNAVNPTALAYRGFVRDQQARDGLPDIEAARAMAPNDPVVYYMLGMHKRLVGDLEAAFGAFERAYWLDPQNPALAAEVGRSWQQLSEFALAEEWLLRAVDLAPDDPQWQITVAAFYADTGFQLDLIGLPFIQEVAGRVPGDPDVRASLAWAYVLTGDLERAYDEISVAMGIDSANPRTRYYFGAILERRGNIEGAVDSYWFVMDESSAERGFGLLAARALQRLGYIAR